MERSDIRGRSPGFAALNPGYERTRGGGISNRRCASDGNLTFDGLPSACRRR
jgi:hypothetical protein